MDYLLNQEGNHVHMVALGTIDKIDLINAWWRILIYFEDPVVTGGRIIIENHTEGLLSVAESREIVEYIMREGYDSQKIAFEDAHKDRPAQAIFVRAFAAGRGLNFNECVSNEEAVRWLEVDRDMTSREVA